MEGLTLKQTEQARLATMNRVLEKKLSLKEAASVLGLSERHAWRMLSAYRKDGAQAFAHGNRGIRPTNAIPEKVRVRVIELARTTYSGFNHTHFAEILAEREGVILSRSTTRNILTNAGLQSPHRRRPPRPRYRRYRASNEGMFLQMDGSHHDWLEGRGSWMTLLLAVDDATGTVPHAIFREQEDTGGYFKLMEGIIQRYGVPTAIYTDRCSVFKHVRPGFRTQAGWELGDQTQFGRAMKDLGISMIIARSPQAKGRVEKMAGTFQDRLVSELRLVSVSSLSEANHFLESFLPRFNMRFGVMPRQLESAYRPLSPRIDLRTVLCCKYSRKVARDNTIKYRMSTFQLFPASPHHSYAGSRVEMRVYPDGNLEVVSKNRVIKTRETPPRPGYFPTSRLISLEPDLVPQWLEKILHQKQGPVQTPLPLDSTLNREPSELKRARWTAVIEARSQGLSLRAIAKLLGMSRKTVRKYKASISPPVYGSGSKVKIPVITC